MQFQGLTRSSTLGRRRLTVTLAVVLVGSVLLATVGFAGTSLAGTPGGSVASVSAADSTAPTADAGPDQTADLNARVSFDGSNSSDDESIQRYRWDVDGDGRADAAGETTSHIFDTPGTHEVTLTVYDEAFNTDSDTVTVTVRDVTPPTARTGPDTTVSTGSSLRFDGSASTDNDAVESYQWDFDGDGVTDATGESPVRTFEHAGTNTVTLTVTDPAGNTDTASVTITVVSDATTSESTPSESDPSGDGTDDETDEGAGSGSDGDQAGTGGSSNADAAGSSDSSGDTASQSSDGPTGTNAASARSERGGTPASVSVREADGVTNVLVENADGQSQIDLGAASDGQRVTVDAITIDANASEYTLNVSEHRHVPGTLRAPNRTTVGEATAGYLQIEHSVADEAIDTVDVTFTVGWDALVNGTTSSEITLYRYHDGEWQALETTFHGYTADGAQLTATSPGLSVFAVGSRLRSNITVEPTVQASRVAVDEPVNVSARVTNHGTAQGFIVVGLRVDGEIRDTASVPLDPGQATTLRLAPVFEEPGTYDVVVEGIHAGTVSVTTEPVSTPTPAPEPTTTAPTGNATATPNEPETQTNVPDSSEPAPASAVGSTADRASGPGPGMGVATVAALALLTAIVRRRD